MHIKKIVLSILFGVLISSNSSASTILETAGYGGTAGGLAIRDEGPDAISYIGARFSLNTATKITEIGGQLQSWSDNNFPRNWNFDRTIFAAIVPLSGPNLFPADISLSDTLFSTVLGLPWRDGNFAILDDVLSSVNIILNRGDYGLVFGSGIFGASGFGWLPYTYTSIDRGIADPTYFTYQSHAYNRWVGLNTGGIEYHPRFIVRGVAVPEPTPFVIMVFGMTCLLTFLVSKKQGTIA